MKKIALDLDDVICNGGFMHLINEFLNSNYTENDVKGYYMQELIPKEKEQAWRKYFVNHNLYDYAVFLDGAYDVIKKLNEKYDLYIISAYISRDMPEASAPMLSNKFNWLSKNLPFIDPSKYIFASKKDVFECDIRIDDKLSNLKGNADLKLLFDSYHNRQYSKEELDNMGVVRVNGWSDIEKLLLN